MFFQRRTGGYAGAQTSAIMFMNCCGSAIGSQRPRSPFRAATRVSLPSQKASAIPKAVTDEAPVPPIMRASAPAIAIREPRTLAIWSSMLSMAAMALSPARRRAAGTELSSATRSSSAIARNSDTVSAVALRRRSWMTSAAASMRPHVQTVVRLDCVW